MTILLVADQQNSFQTYAYVKKLARRLEKSGVKLDIWPEGFEEAEAFLAKARPELIHLHYHPGSRKLRKVLQASEGLNIPVIVTYHEVVRTPEERRAHMEKCLKRTRTAFFLTSADHEAASKVNPRLKDAGTVMRMPAPSDVSEEFMKMREALWAEWHGDPKAVTRILYYYDIVPDTGIEPLLDFSKTLPEKVRIMLAGTVAPGQGKFAKYVKARINYEDLPIDASISKRAMGKKQLDRLLEKAHFIYEPCGDWMAKNYGGTSLHRLDIPYFNMVRAHCFGHPGPFTGNSVQKVVEMVPSPEAMVSRIAEYRAQPDILRERLDEARAFAAELDWSDLAKATAKAYKQLLKTSK